MHVLEVSGTPVFFAVLTGNPKRCWHYCETNLMTRAQNKTPTKINAATSRIDKMSLGFPPPYWSSRSKFTI